MKLLTQTQVSRWFPARSKDANKGSVGRIFIIAGSKGMVGAGVLSAFGAMRAGAGLVRLATVKSQQPVAARRVPLEVTTQGLPEESRGTLSAGAWREIRKTIRKFKPHVLAAGPGFGVSKSVRGLVQKLIRQNRIPIVLDADGLNVLSGKKGIRPSCPLIMTPHPGELSGLLGVSIKQIQSDRKKYVLMAAKRFHCVCVLKGAGTLISDGKTVWKNGTGNPGMASGGTGDVLTGMIAAFRAQLGREKALEAACLGVYLHGLAGDLAAGKLTQSAMLASDMIECLPAAIKRISKK